MLSLSTLFLLLRAIHTDMDRLADHLVDAALERYAQVPHVEFDKLRQSFHLLHLFPDRAAAKVGARIRAEERRDYFTLLENLNEAIWRFGPRWLGLRYMQFHDREEEHLLRWVRVASLIRSPKAFDAIVTLSGHPSCSIRYHFLESLPQIRDPRGRRILYAEIENAPDRVTILVAVNSLDRFKSRDSQIADQLAVYLLDPKGAIVSYHVETEPDDLIFPHSNLSARLVKVIVGQGPYAVPALRRLFAEAGIDPVYRRWAIHVMGSVNSEVRRKMTESLSTELLALLNLDEECRFGILRLIETDGPHWAFALPTLEKRLQAAEGRDALPWLGPIIRIDPTNEVAAKRVLELLKQLPREARSILCVLRDHAAPMPSLYEATLRLAKHSDAGVRYEAIQFLSKYPLRADGIKLLTRIAKDDPSEEVRKSAQAILNRLQ